MANAFDYSTTPASNSSSPPDGAPEDCAPSAVNNIMRQMMANIAALNKVYTATGTGDAQVVTFAPEPDAWTTSTFFYFRPVAANTGSATISNGVSAKTLKLPDAATNLPAGYLQTSNVYGVWYDGTNAVVVSAPGIIESGSATEGRYVKYADGTMQAFGNGLSQAFAITTGSGSGAFQLASAATQDFPVAFSSVISVFIDVTDRSVWATQDGAPGTSSFTFNLFRHASLSSTLTYNYIAIGRWY